MTKKLIFILLVLAVALVAMPAMATAPFYESKYAPAAIETPAMSGMIYIGTACNTNLFSEEFTITRVTNPKNIQFTNGAVVTKEYVDLFPAVNASPFEGELYGTGYWSTTNWAPGIFVVKLLDGNAGDPEYAVFETVAGQTTTIMFQGHAAYIPIATLAPECSPVYTIESASYGQSHCVPYDAEWSEWSRDFPYGHFPFEPRTVIDHAAYTETGNYYVTETKDDGYWVGHGSGRHWVNDYKVKCTNHGEHGDGWHHQTSACTKEYSINHPEVHHHEYRYLIHGSGCNHEGAMDVTYEVREVVNEGNLQFTFDNRPERGGIFSTTGTLLEQIRDPAKDIVKDVTITYSNGCGIDKTIQTKEYCTINLVDGSASCPQEQS